MNDDSNDSVIRKRRKQKSNEQSDQLAKITKTMNDDMKKNAEIQSQQEVKSLSQQLKETTIDSSNVSSNCCSLSEPTANYGKSVSKNESLNSHKSINSQINNQPFTRVNRVTKFINKFESIELSRSMNGYNLDILDKSIETPIKPLTSQTYGPIPKSIASSGKKSKSGRKSKSTPHENLIKKAPIQRRLKITESEPIIQTKKHDKQQLKNNSKMASNEKLMNANTTSRPVRERTLSISSFISTTSTFTDEESSSDLEDIKKKRRQEMSRENSKRYRNRCKEKEKQLNQALIELNTNFLKLKKELIEILGQKHLIIKAIGDNENTLPQNLFLL